MIESGPTGRERRMAERRRLPDRQTRIDNARRGIIDDAADAVSPFDLEEWDARGEPQPTEPMCPPAGTASPLRDPAARP